MVIWEGRVVFEFRDQLKLELINYRCHGNNLKVYFQTRSEAWKRKTLENITFRIIENLTALLVLN